MERFRPIMMTTMAALMGALPIALGFGADGASRRPLGLVVVGGLIVSQFITLYVTPAIYLYLEEFQEKVLDRTSFFRSHAGHAPQPAHRSGSLACMDRTSGHDARETCDRAGSDARKCSGAAWLRGRLLAGSGRVHAWARSTRGPRCTAPPAYKELTPADR